MKTVQLKKERNQDWQYIGKKETLIKPLVLVFGNRYLLENLNIYKEVKTIFPDGNIVFGSSSGEILSNTVTDESLTITAIELENSNYKIRTSNILTSDSDSFRTGKELIQQFSTENLKFIFIVSEGTFINGSELTRGIRSIIADDILVTGALCADDERFEKTLTSYNENPKQGEIVAIGFYGEKLEVSFSSHGGWVPFGPERVVTKSKENILYELDSQPALDLYKKYLGDKAAELPGSALFYPLNVKIDTEKQSIVRTILTIDEERNAMILAGDIPENSKVQLMMTTNIDNITNATELATIEAMKDRVAKPQLAILISCICRKMVLDQRVEEEVEEVVEIVGDQTTISGFYSYGEIAPFHGETACQLHNQTMTVTLISE